MHNSPINRIASRQSQPTSITLVLPAWNEAEVIRSAIHESAVALSAITEDFEIIVVDDGSQDDTASIVEFESEQMSQVRLIRHHTNQGYGAALKNRVSVSDDGACGIYRRRLPI